MQEIKKYYDYDKRYGGDDYKIMLPIAFKLNDFSIRNLKEIKAINRVFFEIIIVTECSAKMIIDACKSNNVDIDSYIEF